MKALVTELRGMNGSSYAAGKMQEAANAIESLQEQRDEAVAVLESWFDSKATHAQIAERAREVIARIRGTDTAPAAAELMDRQQMLADILCTAFEGGIGYWCLADHTTQDYEGNYLTLVDCEDAEDPGTKFGTITLATIQLGIERILSGAVPIRPDLLEDIARSWASNEGDCDADAADCIVQAGLFNEIVYG